MENLKFLLSPFDTMADETEDPATELGEGTVKILTNEKRGGLTGVSFDRSCFKLFSRKFSNKLVQAPSCERPGIA